MFVVTPNGTLVNLDAVTWLAARVSLANPGVENTLWCVDSNVGELSKPMMREEAESLLMSFAEKLGALRL